MIDDIIKAIDQLRSYVHTIGMTVASWFAQKDGQLDDIERSVREHAEKSTVRHTELMVQLERLHIERQEIRDSVIELTRRVDDLERQQRGNGAP